MRACALFHAHDRLRHLALNTTRMSGAERRPTNVSFEAAVRILRDTFPFEDVLESSFKELPCYDDRHFYFEGRLIPTAQRRDPDGGTGGTYERFVLRITNLMFSSGLVEGWNALMLHLSSHGINCSRPVPSREGRYMEMIPGKKISQGSGHYPQEYPVRVLRFVSGTLMRDLDAELLTPKFLYCVGRFAGEIDAALEVSFIFSQRVLYKHNNLQHYKHRILAIQP